jgi:hypothetical protein
MRQLIALGNVLSILGIVLRLANSVFPYMVTVPEAVFLWLLWAGGFLAIFQGIPFGFRARAWLSEQLKGKITIVNE